MFVCEKTLIILRLIRCKGRTKKDFAKIFILGRMNFLHMSSADNPEIDRYVLSKHNKNYLGIWNAKLQRKENCGNFADDLDLQTKILNKEFDKFKDIPGLVSEYNSRNN